ncbi:endonuclease/exonuclease/phosphatase family protein [Microtetraspora malaysiensis]|uniref:endonuclease/exonuclease/phosphatase family protein n=1 Tax=Microtetraspora malaysiensis TaxID=161358 RepID=UPI000836E98D|nr:endonuclease/exonuclease/phosphatase family protein [Microtetraspora malaysiensis]
MSISRRGLLGATAVAMAGVGLAAIPASATVEKRRIKRGVIRVASFNIHYGAGADNVFDLQHVAEVIEAIDADVIGLQEVDKFFRPRSNWLDTASELAKMLGMHHTYGPNIDQDPLEEGQPRRQYGTAFLSRWPILESRNTHLPLYAGSEPRGLLEAVVDIQGKRVRFGNSHMQHTSDAEWQEQADTIVNLLGQSAEPVVFLGDTNAVPAFGGIKTFTDRYDDVWARVGIGEGLSADNKWRFDYVFVPKGTDVRSAWLMCTDASDHQPLVTDLLLS